MIWTAVIFIAGIITLTISVTILMLIVKAYFVALKWLFYGKKSDN